jgi:membrane associated rhomboid family serine protease
MDRPRAVNLPPAVLWLAVLLVAIHVVRHFLSADADLWVVLAFGFTPSRYGPLVDALPGGEGARFWSPVTHAFLHADALHLAVNLIWMASFGSALARRFGSVRFLALSLLSAAAGAGVYLLLHLPEARLRSFDPDAFTIAIGASGAVSGMMAATARFAFAPGGPLSGGVHAAAYRLPAEPLRLVFTRSRALLFILVWFVLNLLTGMAGALLPGVSGPIAWEAHVGGFLAGLLLFPALDPGPAEGDRLSSQAPPD